MLKSTLCRSLVLVYLYGSMSSYSQNLVPNCDFDVVEDCPTSHGQFDLAQGWRTPTLATSDLCHTCAGEVVGIPNNMWGSEVSYSGHGYGHIISYYYFASPNYREYMQAELACPLRTGEEYFVSFFVSLSDQSGFAIDGMGLHFSPDPISRNDNITIDLGVTDPYFNTCTTSTTTKPSLKLPFWIEAR